jgi:hypothetical protein
MNTRFAQHLSEVDDIPFLPLTRRRLVERFNGAEAAPITHLIHPRLQVDQHLEDLCPFSITDIKGCDIKFGKAWIENHGIIPNPVTNSLHFIPDFCNYAGGVKIRETVLLKRTKASLE